MSEPTPSSPPPSAPPPGAAERPASDPATPPAPYAPPPATTNDDSDLREALATRPGLDDRERTLDPRIVTVWRIGSAITMVLVFGAASVAAIIAFGLEGLYVVAASLVLIWWRSWWLPKARYDRWRWQLTALAVELRSGVLVRRYEAVPYFRIQQIDITRGPIDRLLGLATLVVTTASTAGGATLPGIAADDAAPVRAELLARAAEAVAEHPGDLQDAV